MSAIHIWICGKETKICDVLKNKLDYLCHKIVKEILTSFKQLIYSLSSSEQKDKGV